MKTKLTRLAKFVFRIIRAIDRRFVRLLQWRGSFRPHKFIESINVASVQAFDAASFSRYARKPKGSLFLSAYLLIRNGVFASSYRLFRRYVR